MFYNKDMENIYEQFGSKATGLDEKQVELNRKSFGANVLREKKKKSVAAVFFSQFKDLLVIILIIAAGISFATGSTESSVVIILVLILNAVLGTVQTIKADKSLESLKKLSAPMARVLRGGVEMEIDATELVCGDIIRLEAGDVLSADGRIITCHSFMTNESALTGESEPVEKTAETIQTAENLALGDRKNMVFSSSLVTNGRATVIVTAVGTDSELGKIAEDLNMAEERKTPLQLSMDNFSRKLSVGILVVCALVFGLTVYRGGAITDALLFAIALAVAAIPEALSSIITISLAIGTTRMAKENAIIKTLSAVESLGSVSVICSDKTGTLTQNKMTVMDTWLLSEESEMLLKQAAVLCNDSTLVDGQLTGDPTETALIAYYEKLAGASGSPVAGELESSDAGFFNERSAVAGGLESSDAGVFNERSAVAGGLESSDAGVFNERSAVAGGLKSSDAGVFNERSAVAGGLESSDAGVFNERSAVAGGLESSDAGFFNERSAVAGGLESSDAGVFNERSAVAGGLESSDAGFFNERSAVAGGLYESPDVLKENCPRIAELPFDSDRKLMSTLNRMNSSAEFGDRVLMFTKGAPDIVLGRAAGLSEPDRARILAANEAFSRRGLRVLAFAYRDFSKITDASLLSLEDENELIFIGLIAMMDPPRPESAAAVADCIKAGIKPIMITGDHKVTAAAIAKQIGILPAAGAASVVTGIGAGAAGADAGAGSVVTGIGAGAAGADAGAAFVMTEIGAGTAGADAGAGSVVTGIDAGATGADAGAGSVVAEIGAGAAAADAGAGSVVTEIGAGAAAADAGAGSVVAEIGADAAGADAGASSVVTGIGAGTAGADAGAGSVVTGIDAGATGADAGAGSVVAEIGAGAAAADAGAGSVVAEIGAGAAAADAGAGSVVTGIELDRMSDEELERELPNISVFARVSPANKIRIVRALQSRAHIVAMTGDGVNDAPALKSADVGLAMGASGTEVAKDAASIILTDDNFATIIKAVLNGRNIYANIKNSVQFLLSGNTAGIIAVLFASLLGLPAPFTSVQLLFINLVTDSLPALAIGMEPSNPDLIKDKPRSRDESVLTKSAVTLIGLQGALIAAVTIAAFYLGLRDGTVTASTMAFATLCLARLWHGFNCRGHQSIFRLGLWTNKFMLLAFGIGFLLLLAVLLIPALSGAFSVAALTSAQLLQIFALALSPTLIIQIIRFVLLEVKLDSLLLH